MQQYILVLLLLTSCFSYSQEKKDNSFFYVENDNRNNLLKANFLFLAIPSVSIQYERKVFKKSSVGVTLNYTGEQDIPFIGIINKRLGNHEFTKNQLKNVRYNSKSISPEFRFYFGKEAFKGFYIGPFLRYAFYNIKFPLDYKVEAADILYSKIDFKGNIKAFTAGVSIGAQWEILNNCYIDWLIVGPHIGFSKEYLYANKQLSRKEQIAIEESLTIIKDNLQTLNKIPGLNIPNVDFDHDVNENGAKIKFNEDWAGIKMFLGFGYRF